jgi:type I restriction enzyme, S subunit
MSKELILPESWSTEKLSILCDKPTYGFTAAASKNGNAKLLRITDIEAHKVDWHSVPSCDIDAAKFDQFKLYENDIVFARIGATTGKSYIIKNPPANAVYASYLIRVRPKQRELHPDYLYYFFNSPYYWEQIDAEKRNNLKLGVNGSILQQLIIIKPPYKNQEKIAYILSTLQKAIHKQEEIINTTTALKKSLLNSIFTENTKGEPLKQTEVGMIPESWESVPIGSLGKVVTGSTPKTSVAEYYQPAEYDFIAPVDIGKNWIVDNAQKKISSQGLAVSRALPKNTVLAVCIGSTIGKVGLTSKELSATNQQINAIVCNEAVNNPLFIYYLLTFYNNLWKEAATPSPVPILTKGQFEKILIPYTDDLQEQTLIAESLKVFENKLKFHSNKKSIYENLFRTLLNELMTGTIRVHDLDFHSKASSSKTVTAHEY